MQLACQNQVIKFCIFKTNFRPRFKVISKKKKSLPEIIQGNALFVSEMQWSLKKKLITSNQSPISYFLSLIHNIL